MKSLDDAIQMKATLHLFCGAGAFQGGSHL